MIYIKGLYYLRSQAQQQVKRAAYAPLFCRHWSEKDCMDWSKSRLSQLFSGLIIADGSAGLSLSINSLESVSGVRILGMKPILKGRSRHSERPADVTCTCATKTHGVPQILTFSAVLEIWQEILIRHASGCGLSHRCWCTTEHHSV